MPTVGSSLWHRLPVFLCTSSRLISLACQLAWQEAKFGNQILLGDDISLDDAIDRLYLLRKIELGIAQADAGDVLEHDAFIKELEAEDAQ